MSGDFEQDKSRVCQSEGAYATMRPLASSWEQRKFSDIVDVCSGKDYKHLEEGPIPVYGTGGFMTSVDEALSYDRDAVGIGRKGTIDKPYLLKAPFWTVDTLFYAIPKPDMDLEFVHCSFLNVDWKSKDESTGLPSLSKEAINETIALVPSFNEQSRIGEFFNGLDFLITLHQREPPHMMKEDKNANRYQRRIAFLRLLLAMD
ncbi:restriction endonuclease subunit S [Olsenella uli]|uniref:restriction endonuclease subunit S n=1 Tax=Olsenella uli TaxID=133926 RepID=UPI003D7B2CE2